MTETTMERLLSAQELADHLGVSVFWVRDMTRRRKIPYLQLSPQVRKYRLSKVEEWLAGMEQRAR